MKVIFLVNYLQLYLMFLVLGQNVPGIDARLAANFEKVYPGLIKGPKSYEDKIVIVGAGPSGIHMAYLLKEQGFKNVQVIEKTDRIGGKSKSIEYRGAVHEMGTAYISADYELSILNLIKKFTKNKLVSAPIASVWDRYVPNGMALDQYIFLKLKLKYPTRSLSELKIDFSNKIRKYAALHQLYFGTYNGELMPEPKEEVRGNISGTFMDYLNRHQLEDLKDLFTATFTLQGYGHLDDTPALYGCMWNTPSLMLSIINFLEKKGEGIQMLSDGFEGLWRAIAKASNISITYNVDIRYIHADPNAHDAHGNQDKIFLYYKTKSGSFKIKAFDFLIWTPPANDLMQIVGGVKMETERKLFHNMVEYHYSTSLVDSKNTKRSQSPVDWWFDNIDSKRELSIWASRDSYSMFQGSYGANYTNKTTQTGDDNDTEKRTSVFYQYSKRFPAASCMTNKLKDHLKYYNSTDIEVIAQYRWPYFQRFDEAGAEQGKHWRVLDVQGSHKIWFAGSSVCFESVKSVVEYNLLLVSRMEAPQ